MSPLSYCMWVSTAAVRLVANSYTSSSFSLQPPHLLVFCCQLLLDVHREHLWPECQVLRLLNHLLVRRYSLRSHDNAALKWHRTDMLLCWKNTSILSLVNKHTICYINSYNTVTVMVTPFKLVALKVGNFTCKINLAPFIFCKFKPHF